MTLRIAKNFTLTDDFVTKTAAIVAQRRKGKTYTACVIAEELIKAGLPWVAIDPTGAWWGLRASADGKKEGLPVVVLGGQHGDAPLDRYSGKVVAELVVENPGWYVLDMSLFESKGAERDFSADFAEALYRRKGQPERDFPMHLFVDEADMFVPQDRESGDQRMIGAFQSIVRRGGLRGLGTTLISQRPALVNKSVLVQLDILVVLRLVAGNDQDYVKKNYFERAGTKEQVAALMESMARLDLGDAWFWEPGEDVFERIQVRERDTFNSSVTPKPGEKRIEPTKLAKVDLESVKEVMATAIEKAKSEDPHYLRQQITKLKQELRQALELEPVTETVVKEIEIEVEVPVVPPALIRELPLLSERIAALIDEVNKANEVTRIRKALEKPNQGYTPKPSSTSQGKPPTASVRVPPNPTQTQSRLDAGLNQDPGLNGSNSLGQGEQKVLNALAQFPEGCTTAQANMLCGFSRKSSSLGTIVGRLRKMGYVHEADGTPGIRITQVGLEAVGGPRPALSGEALVDHWMSHPRMDAASKKVLSALMSQWPDEVSMEYLFDETGFSPTSSSVGTALGRLRGLGLVDKNRRRATSEFMEAVHYP